MNPTTTTSMIAIRKNDQIAMKPMKVTSATGMKVARMRSTMNGISSSPTLNRASM